MQSGNESNDLLKSGPALGPARVATPPLHTNTHAQACTQTHTHTCTHTHTLVQGTLGLVLDKLLKVGQALAGAVIMLVLAPEVPPSFPHTQSHTNTHTP